MQIKETIPSDLDIVPDFISRTVERLYHLPLDEDIIFAIKLCLQEAVVNAVKHGNGLDASLKVDVVISLDNSHLSLEVTDQGKGFTPKEVPDPTTPENIAKLSGRGLFLIKKLMNKVQFNNGGRTIRMTKILKKGRKVKVDVKVEKINDVAVIILDGEINVSNSQKLRELIKKTIAEGSRKISVDFEKVTFIDSSGLAVMIEAVQDLEKQNGQLRLCHVNSKIRGIFEITKIHKIIGIYDNREMALKDF